MRLLICLFSLLSWAGAYSQDSVTPDPSLAHPLYAGIGGGYGSTTWEGLVPTSSNLNLAMRMSTPLVVNEGGGVWGAFAGYEFGPHFALEASYYRYPDATISFDEESFFAFDHDGTLDLHTDTDAISIMAKIMLTIPRTPLRAYSSFGVAQIHRWDMLSDTRHDSPTFGLGFIFNASQHIMAELAVNYTAGYGESELNPARDYVPFLYAGVFKLAYRI